ncbi:MAG: DNA photolyase family protein [Actinobacteria bacterium]|nr:DNA photolyase family protein [Actinomycetota bacterium]
MTSVMWFRRDLRLADNPALIAAAEDGDVLPLFVLDPALWGPAGPSRRTYLAASLRSLDASLRQRRSGLSVVRGDPVRRVVLAAKAVGADTVHVAADFGPYGSRRDEEVEKALADAGIELVRTGSPYAVAPGRVRNGSGDPYKVFTPFSRAWADHGWRGPVDAPTGVSWLDLDEHTDEGTDGGTTDIPDPQLPAGLELPEAGEAAALRRWEEFLDRVDAYAEDRDKPGIEGTSRMSVHLKYGEVHPRTLLADLARRRSEGARVYRTELAWREFYADVLHTRPETAREYYRPEYAQMAYDRPGDQLTAWQEGRTGFPIVDAGMRQLRAQGWMHNRVRMIVASFLVKDLHVEWQHGARHFLHWLVDGDLASNNHGWQWTAGSGTDASPFFRVFNPTTQGKRFDPPGDYVRRWVEELSDPEQVPDPHDPDPDTRDLVGYPAPMVDHKEERQEALDRWERIRG